MDSSSPHQNQRTLKSVVLDVRAGLASLKEARDAKQHAYLVSLLRSESIVLAERCWERHLWLDTEDQRLTAQRDELFDEELKEQDDKWILAFRQYQSAMDLLGEVLQLTALPAGDNAQQAKADEAAPHAQEALL